LNSAVASVPDGLASGLLAGVNPIFGLYACMAGPIAGGIFASTQLLVMTTTSASALAAGQALAGVSADARANALFLLVIVTGAIQIVFGLLRFGRLARFVSHSVMTGFLTGIAVLTILSQLPTVTGYEAVGANRVGATFDLLANLGQVDLPTLAISALTLVLALLLPRTPLGDFGTLAAIVVPSVLVAALGLESIRVVQDVGEIPRGLPTPFLPSLSAISGDVLTGALAVAVIILVQGAANVASGFFRGLPVGGSLSTTALSVLSGARTRWAAIFAGLWMAIVVVALPNLVALVAMPPLGTLLIVASASAIKPAEALSIWNTGWPSRLAIVTTFLATLLLPIQAAVGIGVALSSLLFLFQASTNVSVFEQVERPDGQVEEREPPARLRSRAVTVLHVYGHLFYAGAQTLGRMLPSPEGAKHPAVILRLRGHTAIGATLVDVLANYASQLEEVEGRLYLTGTGKHVRDQITRTGKLRAADSVHVYEATAIVGDSTRRAVADAHAWLATVSDVDDSGEGEDDSQAIGGGNPESQG
jgi:SulP family sulfate permease